MISEADEDFADLARALADALRDYARERHTEYKLRVAELQVKPSQRPFYRPRVIVLHKRAIDAVLSVCLCLIRFDEETSIVTAHMRLDDDHTW